MTKSARVLQIKPGKGDWTFADFPVGRSGFDLATKRAMTGSEFIQGINLGDQFRLICDEEGRTKKLPIAMCIGLSGGYVLPIFGQFAILRTKMARLHGGCYIEVGLRPGDEEVIRSSFAWYGRVV